MKIRFTEHAKMRCMLRKIPEQWVKDHLKNIPMTPGTHEKRVEGTKLTVVYHDGTSTRYVITLYAADPSPEEVTRKAYNQFKTDDVQDIVRKELQKSDRRKKQVRRLKKR